MARTAFGSWGAELSANEFAQAVAAAGALESPRGPPPVRVEGELMVWRLPEIPPHGPADLFSALWRDVVGSGAFPRRLVVAQWPAEIRLPWLVRQLSLPIVGLDGVFAEGVVSQGHVRWSWPLQVAILDEGRSLLREQLDSDPPWWLELAERVEVAVPDPCDVVLVPTRLRGAVARVLAAPVTASAVVVLERLDESWERAQTMIRTIAADAGAGAVAFAPAGESSARWLGLLVKGLSHDEGLDTALFGAARALDLPTPLLFAERSVLEETRMTRVQERLGRRARESMAMANGGGGPLEAMAERAEAAPSFDHETAGASVLAEVAREVRATEPPRPPRFIQAELSEAREQTPVRVLRPSTLHELQVWIGPRETGAVTAPTLFPDHELPPDVEHRLTVVLTAPQLLEEPQVAELMLPPTGRSESCSFWLNPDESERPFEGRVIVLHEGRVLQTMLLRGEITNDEVDDKRALRFELEALIHPAAGLAGRTRFDAAFVLNHDREEVPRVTLVAGENVDIREPADVSDALAAIEVVLESLATADVDAPADAPKPTLRDERTREQLVALAREGTLLYQAVSDLAGGASLASAERIQIVSADAETFFPLEFVYDRKWPDLDAQLCPNAEHALRTGRCDDCPSLTGNAHVCPLGFWCLSKIIERHAHDAEAAAEVEHDYRLALNAPVENRNRLRALDGSLFAASGRADRIAAGTTAAVLAALGTATGVPAVEARTWADWTQSVDSSSPALLVVLPHTLKEGRFDALEIASGPALPVGKIDQTYVSGDGSLVLLLGCDTGDTTIPFQRFPAAFRRSGAAIVIATLTKVLGRYAGPVAERLVEALAQRARERSTTFGELMRDVRRTLLAEGVVTVLVVTAYGDADWILSPADGG